MNTIALPSGAARPPVDAAASALPARPATAVRGEPGAAPLIEAGDTPSLAGWSPSPRRRGMLVLVAALHLIAAWGLAHSLVHSPAPPKPEPVQVRLIAPPPPPPPQPVHHVPVDIKMPLVAPVPLIPPPPISVTAPVVVAVVDPSPAAVARPEPAPVAPPPVAAPAPGVRELPPGSVRYMTEPRLHVPRMSRRLGESGTVLLHIAVDAQGMLKSAVIKKSSGFERLDQQALQDIRTARFEPYLEKGQAVEWQADAGLQYEVR